MTVQIPDTDHQAILEREAQLLSGILEKDRARSGRCLAENFVAIGHAGNLVDGNDFLDIHFSPRRDFTEYRTQDRQVATLAPGIARIVGWTVATVRGADPVPPKRYAAILRRGADGLWRFVLWQETPILDDEHTIEARP